MYIRGNYFWFLHMYTFQDINVILRRFPTFQRIEPTIFLETDISLSIYIYHVL